MKVGSKYPTINLKLFRLDPQLFKGPIDLKDHKMILSVDKID